MVIEGNNVEIAEFIINKGLNDNKIMYLATKSRLYQFLNKTKYYILNIYKLNNNNIKYMGDYTFYRNELWYGLSRTNNIFYISDDKEELIKYIDGKN